MPPIPAIPLGKLLGSKLDDSGNVTLLQFEMPDGNSINLALEIGQITPLIGNLLIELGKAVKLQKDTGTAVRTPVLPVHYWQIGETDTPGKWSMQLTVGDEGRIAFLFDGNDLPLIRETLQALEGQASNPPPGQPKQ